MKNVFLFTLLVACFQASAQVSIKKVITKPKLKLELKLIGEGGKNGATLTYNPKYKTYYTLVAGNAGFPIDVFDEKGKVIQTIECGVDGRGIMYNPKYDVIEMNTYAYHDIVSITFNQTEKNGKLVAGSQLEEIYEMDIQEAQALVDLDTAQNKYVYLDMFDSEIEYLDTESGAFVKSLKISLPVSKESINLTTVAYTGIKGGEYAILNFVDQEVYLVNAETGKVGATIKLPDTVKTLEMFNWGFANKHIWIFDIDKRTWFGFQIVK